jgi:hypothetical protein
VLAYLLASPHVPQLGFMLKMPMPRVLPAEQERTSVS